MPEFQTEANALILECQNLRKNINGETIKVPVHPGNTEQNQEGNKEMSIKVTASKINLVEKEDSNLKAICEIELNEIIQLKGIRVMDGKNGLFVSYPAYKNNSPDAEHLYNEYIYFANKDIKDIVSKQILKAYKMEQHQRKFEHKINVQCTILPDSGSTKAVATVAIDEMRIGNVRVMEGKGGLFVSYPSVIDENSKTGYTDVIMPVKYVREQINDAVMKTYKQINQSVVKSKLAVCKQVQKKLNKYKI
jgi:stage V sporulation protein G